MNTTERYCPTCGASNKPDETQCFACGSSMDAPEARTDEDTSAAHILKQRYRLLSQVGAGGFSAVYKAEDLQTRQLVAVKAVSLRGLNAQEKIEATDAFNREVNILTTLNHRNLPHIYDHFTDPECWYLVMDFIDGMTLEKYLEDRGETRLPLEETLDLGLLLCDVLDYLHTRHPPIIFRDIKPANMMLTRDGAIYLIDFGIARRFKPGQARDTIPFGSPGYAAPEQYGRTQTNQRADIYSLGAILHQLLTGEDPANNAFVFTTLPDQHQPGMSHLATLIARMVDIDASKRPEHIKEVREELEQVSKEIQAKRGAYWGAPQPVGTATRIYHPHFPPPSVAPSSIIPAGAAGQVAAFQMAAQGQAQAIPSLPNHYATSSLIFSLIGIFLPPFLCFAATSLMQFSLAPSTSLIAVLVGLMLPSLLGVIFGHIGKKRAKTIPGMQGSNDTAVTGMTIGYIFGSLYLLLAACILVSSISISG